MAQTTELKIKLDTTTGISSQLLAVHVHLEHSMQSIHKLAQRDHRNCVGMSKNCMQHAC